MRKVFRYSHHVAYASPPSWLHRTLPPQPSPITALSVGNEIINLRRITPQLGLGPELDAALAALAQGDSGAANARLPPSTAVSPRSQSGARRLSLRCARARWCFSCAMLSSSMARISTQENALRFPRAAYPRPCSSNASGLHGRNSARIGESARAFKEIICDDVSEFESDMPSHAVWSLGAITRCGCAQRCPASDLGGIAHSGGT
jgi:hypothetical protein